LLTQASSWASQAHLPYFTKTSHYKIVALQNSSKASAEASAKTYGLTDVATYGSPDELAADPNVDLVIVSVKVPEHAGLTEPVIRAKKDVFVEWPLGRNLAEAEQLTNLARENKIKTFVGLQARHNPTVRKAKAMVAAGELGGILGTTMNAAGLIFGPVTTEDFLYGNTIEHGANLITIPAGHAMDALCYVLGEFASLQATLANNRPVLSVVNPATGAEIRKAEKTSHDYMAVIGSLKRGGVASIVYQGGSSSTGKNFYWEINGTNGSLVIEGPSGHVQMFQPTLKFVSAAPGAKLEPVEVAEAKDFSYNVGSAYDAFVGKGDGSVTTFEDAVVRHRMIEAIYKSDRDGTREFYKDTY
jgi:predicted dehydrogenase